ncbi:unnamed protein product [Gongylonema pulchrum]|uniref:Pre-mRNA-processing-splicing factor 8 n=1 Tax=Gongylonema pulchrum TaxID=637853 RepID=A0A183D5M0_9BILA|nr:unnamed protein product [Gongylonema pulchrum]
MGSGSSAPAPPRASHDLGKPAAGGGGGADENAADQQKVDARLPYANFRELFTLKNYWKTVRRNERDCAKTMLANSTRKFARIYFLFSTISVI